MNSLSWQRTWHLPLATRYGHIKLSMSRVLLMGKAECMPGREEGRTCPKHFVLSYLGKDARRLIWQAHCGFIRRCTGSKLPAIESGQQCFRVLMRAKTTNPAFISACGSVSKIMSCLPFTTAGGFRVQVLARLCVPLRCSESWSSPHLWLSKNQQVLYLNQGEGQTIIVKRNKGNTRTQGHKGSKDERASPGRVYFIKPSLTIPHVRSWDQQVELDETTTLLLQANEPLFFRLQQHQYDQVYQPECKHTKTV